MRLLLLTAVALSISFAAALPTNTTRTAPPAKADFPFPYRWDKFPTAWFAANATNWEDEVVDGHSLTAVLLSVAPCSALYDLLWHQQIILCALSKHIHLLCLVCVLRCLLLIDGR